MYSRHVLVHCTLVTLDLRNTVRDIDIDIDILFYVGTPLAGGYISRDPRITEYNNHNNHTYVV